MPHGQRAGLPQARPASGARSVRPAPLAMNPVSITPASGRADALVLLGCGGRNLAWPLARIRAELERLVAGRPVIQLIHGGARGADAAICAAGAELGWPVLEMPALWQRYGRGAGMIRNGQMLEQAISLAKQSSRLDQHVKVGVIAFPGGPGTASMVRLARAAAPGGWVGVVQIGR